VIGDKLEQFLGHAAQKEERMSAQMHDAIGRWCATEMPPTTETFLALPCGICIFLRAWIPPQLERLVICVQGHGGHRGYYSGLAAQLVPEGIGVIAAELRGHGRSMGRRGDIDHFARYLEDVDATVRWARMQWPATPVIMLGESMGASIALRYVGGMQSRPDAASRAGLALLAPVFQPAIQATPREVARFVHAALSGPSRPRLPVTGREELGCRDQAFNERLRADPLFVRHVSARFIFQLTWWIWHTRHSAP
jgi:alpha-beta hydrolase superfamily lysophospholipase